MLGTLDDNGGSTFSFPTPSSLSAEEAQTESTPTNANRIFSSTFALGLGVIDNCPFIRRWQENSFSPSLQVMTLSDEERIPTEANETMAFD